MNYLMQIGNRLKNWRVKSIKIGIGIMGSHLNMNIIEVKDYHQVL